MNTLQAIKKINPNAKVSITQKNNEDEVITWLDGTAEISQADIDAKKSEFAYLEKRAIEYPSQASGNTKLLDLGLTQEEATALTGYSIPVVEEEE